MTGFGFSVSVGGTTAVVGAPGDDKREDAGAAYVFERMGGQWQEVVKLTAPGAADNDQFGRSVSVSGTTVVVGAYLDDTKATDAGAAYVFERNATSGEWARVANLTAPDAVAGDWFGFSVSASGTKAVVGAPKKDTVGSEAGAAYAFERNATSGQWERVTNLTAPSAAAYDWFGVSVSVSGTTAFVGAYLDGTKATNAGAAYVFEQ